MAGNIAVEGVMKDILRKIEEWEKREKDPEVFIRRLKTEINQIIKACQSGWY